MPRKSSRGKKKRPSGPANGGRQVVDVTGMMARMGLPVPRLPFLIGSNKNLSARDAVYPAMVKLDFPIEPQFTSLVAGAVATVIALNYALIENWTNAAALFGEYAIVGFRGELRISNVVNAAGLVLVYMDEKSSSAPTAATATGADHLERLVSNTESPSAATISWMSTDYIDLEWTATGNSTTPAWLKIYAATGTTGTTATTTGQVIVTGAISLCFRGYVQ